MKLNLPLNVPLASVKHFGSQELSNTGWALATLMLTNHELLGAIEERQWMVLNASKPQELASISWGFAILQHWAEPLLVAMARRLLSEVELEARHLSSTAWAFARTLLLEMPLLVRMLR